MDRVALRNVLWMSAGAAALAVFLVAVGLLRPNILSDVDLETRAAKYRLVSQMRLDLVRESEAEKRAVMTEDDRESVEFAGQARAALAEVERRRTELETLLRTQSTDQERNLLEEFARAFAELVKVDDVLLDLAVRNTNVKAYHLTFGEAAKDVGQIEQTLGKLGAAESGTPKSAQAAQLADQTTIAVLHVQALLAPHIAEGSEAKMDEIERQIDAEKDKAKTALGGLDRLAPLRDPDSLKQAKITLDAYWNVVGRILVLSRENTNVLSLQMSLDQKRRLFALCQDALAALQDLLPEPMPAAGKFGRK